MPELPEVETVMRGMERALTGKVIKGARQMRPDLRAPFPEKLVERLNGQKIINFRRRAKYILMTLGSGEVFVLHLGMSGRVMIIDAGREIDRAAVPEKHDHLLWDMEDGTRFIYRDPRRFGMVYLMPEQDLDAHKAFAMLGPEPLGNDFSAPVLFAALQKRTGPIKTALLDQRVVAGLGNIYVCEALYRAKIHPERRACDVTEVEAECLTGEIKDTLLEAIEAGGSTLKDYRHTDDGLGYFQHAFKVYDREGLACVDCGCDTREKSGGIRRIVQAGRSTFYCPDCQK